MIKMNKKGFVLTETLMVTVFVVAIFVFIYSSVIPLIGKYRDMAMREQNIDIAYKLYHIRKMLLVDNNKDAIISNNVIRITCDNLNKVDYCRNLMQALDLSNYELYFTKSIKNNLNDSKFSQEVKEYIKKYNDEDKNVVIMLDKTDHSAVHLDMYELRAEQVSHSGYRQNALGCSLPGLNGSVQCVLDQINDLLR